MAENQEAWTSQAFRQNVRAKIEETIRQAGNPTSKSAQEMENHVFLKAKTKEEYLGFVARLIIHVKEMNSKKPQGGMGQLPPNGGGPMMAGAAVGQGGGGPDPMSALRTLAGGQQAGQQQGLQMVPGGPQAPNPALGQAPPTSQGMVNPMGVAGNRFPGAPPGAAVMMNSQQIVNQNVHFSKLRRPMGNFPENMAPFVGGQAQAPPPAAPPQPYPTPTVPQYQGHSPLQVPGGQAVPSPVQVVSSSASGGMAPSPVSGAYAPSPTSQVVPSPVGGFPSRTPNAPSPSNILMQSGGGTVPSPVSRNQQEDQMYYDKLKQLSKYIEPLRKMMAGMDQNDVEKKELIRMKQLLEILTDPTKNRCPYEVLLRCEQVLERMDFNKKIQDSGTGTLTTAGATKPQEHVFQPLLDAIAANIKLPNFNHIMHKTFGHIANGLLGPRPYVATTSLNSNKRRCTEPPDASGEIPDVVQGEIARLDPRFKVQRDASQHPGSTVVHLVCQLDDKNLPCVPPINITIPADYPEHPPNCNIACIREYETTPFLQRIQNLLSSRMENMPPKFSVSLLLNAWEMSVRQACSPIKSSELADNGKTMTVVI